MIKSTIAVLAIPSVWLGGWLKTRKINYEL